MYKLKPKIKHSKHQNNAHQDYKEHKQAPKTASIKSHNTQRAIQTNPTQAHKTNSSTL